MKKQKALTVNKQTKDLAMDPKRTLLIEFYRALYKAVGYPASAFNWTKKEIAEAPEWRVDGEIRNIRSGHLEEIVNVLTRPDLPEAAQSRFWQMYMAAFQKFHERKDKITPEQAQRAYEFLAKEAQKIKKLNGIPVKNLEGTDPGIVKVLDKVEHLALPPAAAPQRKEEEPVKEPMTIDVAVKASFLGKVKGKYKVANG